MRTVIVTGGSRGTGLAIVNRLVEGGYRTVVVARNASEGMEEAVQKRPELLRFIQFDLARTDEIAGLVKRLYRDEGPLYGLVNNAALGTDGALALMHNSRIEEMVQTNIVAPIILSKYVVRRMMADGGGRIVNIASIAAFTGYSGLSVYAATKSSLIGFTRSLAREVGRMGVNVNAIAPGFMDTDMTRSVDVEEREQIARRSALGRMTDIEDVAGAVEFLLGDTGRSITGTVLTVDAGATA